MSSNAEKWPDFKRDNYDIIINRENLNSKIKVYNIYPGKYKRSGRKMQNFQCSLVKDKNKIKLLKNSYEYLRNSYNYDLTKARLAKEKTKAKTRSKNKF